TAKGFALWGWNDPYLERPASPPANEAQALYSTADGAGYFVKIADGQSFDAPGSNSKAGFGMMDFTNPAARSFWSARVGDAVAAGFHGFKLDYGEDGVPDLLNGRLGLRYFDGTTDRTAREYPLGYHGAYRDALASTADGGVLIVRASTYGGAQVADVIWPGDLDNGFQHRGDKGSNGSELVGGLPASIIAGQTLAASGFPLYGADVAGYRGDMPTSESLLRWSEASALSMVMQLGPGEKKYPWIYDAQTVVTYTQLAALHQKIVPYLAALLANAQRDGTPTIRSLPLMFPTDPGAITAADDEYMLGPSLLAAPVVVEGATQRQVHLPPGTWFSWWDGTRVDGPVNVTLQAPLGQPPLFVRAGAIIAELPDGIDTLFPATDPSTVSVDALSGFAEALAWVSGGASATTYDGGQIAITDDASGVGISWTPKGPATTLTMTIDLAARTGKIARLTTATGTDGTNVRAATYQGDVTSSTDNAAFLSENMLYLRLVGAGAVIVQ
ncbi:MAG: TIM-barrel domain-containing protein, partial [Polyangiaceae bacterium]